MSDNQPAASAERVRALNDALRNGSDPLAVLLARGQLMITRGIADRGPAFVDRALAAVRAFDAFSADNDPYGEHDFGNFELDGIKLFWKIDYYDNDLQWGSPDPADSAVTKRVLTILLAAEY
jgi:hypothetical protein